MFYSFVRRKKSEEVKTAATDDDKLKRSDLHYVLSCVFMTSDLVQIKGLSFISSSNLFCENMKKENYILKSFLCEVRKRIFHK